MRKSYLFIASLFLLSITSCKNSSENENQQKSEDLTKDVIADQTVEDRRDKFYDFGEKVFKLNGLNLAKISKNHMDLVNAIGVKPDSIKERGAAHFEEFGYRFYECYVDGDLVEISQGYNIEQDTFFVFSFSIRSTELDVNGIKVGDAIEKVKKEFLKHEEIDDAIVVYLGDNAVAFDHEKGVIAHIGYYTPL